MGDVVGVWEALKRAPDSPIPANMAGRIAITFVFAMRLRTIADFGELAEFGEVPEARISSCDSGGTAPSSPAPGRPRSGCRGPSGGPRRGCDARYRPPPR